MTAKAVTELLVLGACVVLAFIAVVSVFRKKETMNAEPATCKVDENTSDGYHTFAELYEHRHALFIALMRQRPELSWLAAAHDDGSMFAGWFIAGMNLPTGIISYHLPLKLWEMALATGAAKIERAPVFDGHTSDDVIQRLQDWLKQ